MDDLAKLALEQIQESEKLTTDWRKEAEIDLAFAAGDQWPKSVRDYRERNRLPVLTIDRIEPAVAKIVGEHRKNDVAVKAIKADNPPIILPDGKPLAYDEFINGLMRSIHHDSMGEYVVSTAFEHMCLCGVGAWYLQKQYDEGYTFDQEIRMKRVLNPLSVYGDVAGRWEDRMRYAHIVESLTETEYRERFKESPPGGINVSTDGMIPKDGVLLSLWHNLETRKEKIVMARLADGTVQVLPKDSVKDIPGIEVIREREAEMYSVKRYLTNGHEILEETEWPGSIIPVFILYGQESVIGTNINWRGIVRKARDPQRMYNYYRSTVAEMLGAAPKAPYIGTAAMFRGHESEWASANTGERTYLTFEPDPSAPGASPQRNQMDYPQGLDREALISSDDIKAVTKIHDASLGARSNETSGKAIRARQMEADMGNYWYLDNFLQCMDLMGRCLLQAIPKIYDGTRKVYIRSEDGKITRVLINQRGPDGIINQVLPDEMGVEVITGPAFTTMREEGAAAMVDMAQAYKPLMEIAGDEVMGLQDIPGADRIAERIKRHIAKVSPHVLDDSDPMRQVGELQQQLAQMQQQLAQLMGGQQ